MSLRVSTAWLDRRDLAAFVAAQDGWALVGPGWQGDVLRFGVGDRTFHVWEPYGDAADFWISCEHGASEAGLTMVRDRLAAFVVPRPGIYERLRRLAASFVVVLRRVRATPRRSGSQPP